MYVQSKTDNTEAVIVITPEEQYPTEPIDGVKSFFMDGEGKVVEK